MSERKHVQRQTRSPSATGLWLMAVLALFLGTAAILLSGCDLSSAEPTALPGQPTATPAPSQPASAPTDEVEATPAPSVMTLTIWTTEFFSPTETFTSGQVLAQQVTLFEEAYPDVRLQFIRKKLYGKGGILDYLLTTQSVVPSLLPDLVLIDVDELRTAVQAKLIQPLDELVPADLIADLYPFARTSATVDGRLYALQVQADLDHLVYNTGKMAVPPRSWPGVLSNPGPYIFPAGGQAGLVNDAFLIQYLAVQPESSDSAQPGLLLDEDSLTAVLQYYQDGVSRGIFPLEILDYHTTDDAWRDYRAGEAALTHVSAHRYLEERDDLLIAAPAPIPTINGPAAAISRGWALALVATDPARQSAAVAFLRQLMTPETNAAWNRAAKYLPTRQSALAFWDVGDSYTPFIDQRLQAARPRPVVANYTQIAAALQEAVEDVVTGAATPEEAAAQVIEKTR